MRPRRASILSLDRIERRDTLRRVVKAVAAEHHRDETELGASLGYTPSRFRRLMTFGELPGLAAADTPLLCEVLDSDAPLELMATARGFRLVRELAAAASPGEVLAGAAGTMEAVAALVSSVTAALPDGIDPLEARGIQTRIDQARRALAELEGRVASCGLEPVARRSGR